MKDERIVAEGVLENLLLHSFQMQALWNADEESQDAPAPLPYPLRAKMRAS